MKGRPRQDASPVNEDAGSEAFSTSETSQQDPGSIRAAPLPPVRPRRADDEAFVQNTSAVRSVSPSEPFQDAPDGDKAGPLAHSNAGINLQPSSPIVGESNNKRTYAGQPAKEPPSDAFYYGSRSPTGTVFSTRGETPVQPYPRTADSQDLARYIRENTVLRAALEKSSLGNPPQEEQAIPSDNPGDEEMASAEVLLDHILQLQEDCSRLKVSKCSRACRISAKLNKAALQEDMVEKVELALEELGDAERQRDAALQETAYLKARLTILETENSNELSDLDRERVLELEEYLATSHRSKCTFEAQVMELERKLHRLSDDLESWRMTGDAASERALMAEERERDIRLELESAQDHASQLETRLRGQMAENAAHTSTLQQRALALEEHEQEKDKLQKQRSGHLLLIEQTRLALQTAEQRNADLATRFETATDRAQMLERELMKLNVQLEEQRRTATEATERADEADVSIQTARKQLEHYRQLAESGFSQLFSSEHSAERSLTRDHGDNPENSAALSQECASLRKMLNEAGSQIEAAQTNLMRQRQDLQESRLSATKLHAEIRACQTQRKLDSETISDLHRVSAARSGEHQKLRDEVSRLKSRCDVLRRLLSDHGISEPDNGAEPVAGNLSSIGTQEQSEEQARTLEAMKLELDRIKAQLKEKQSDASRASGSLHDNAVLNSERSDQSEVNLNEVRELRTRVTEMEAAHKKKLQQVEADYQTAVRYVK